MGYALDAAAKSPHAEDRMMAPADDLPARLREYADKPIAYSRDSYMYRQLVQDLREAAGELERHRAASNPGIKMPTGCVCPPDSWDCNDIEPICDSYDGSMGEHCWHCEHDKACHKP